jgi:uncharacterized membrane protein
MSLASRMFSLEPIVSQSIRLVGNAIEVLGVSIIVLGIVAATALFVGQGHGGQRYDAYRLRIARALLLGLEVLVAAVIVKTIAFEFNPKSLGVVAGLILVRTFLSWTLTLEIEGRWPWQREGSRSGEALGPRLALIDSRAIPAESAKASARR